MNLFLSFLAFEIKFRLKSVSTYVYFFALGLVAFLSVSTEDWFSVVGPGRVMLNGPYATLRLDIELCLFGILLLAGVFGPAILRDFQQDTYQLLFTKPISKFAYLGGRWFGSFVVSIFIFGGIIFGEVLGSFAPWADHARILAVTPNLLGVYLQIFFDIPVLQIFFVGSLFFMVAALTRNMVIVYLQGVALFAVYLILLVSVVSTQSLDLFKPSLADPIGIVLIRGITRYWTVVEQNSLLPAWHGVFLYNRLIWTGVGAICLIATYTLFPMGAEALAGARASKKKRVEEVPEGPPRPRFHVALPATHQIFNSATTLRQFVSLTRLRMRNIFREVPFWGIAGIMVINVMSGAHFAGRLREANVWPVTALMVQTVEGSSLLFFYIVATMYAGELVWRERDTHFQQVHDALPIGEWIDWGSKFVALCAVELAMLAGVLLCGIVSQTLAGYYNFELAQYIKELFGVTFLSVATFCLFALFVQSLVTNKYLGHAIAVAAVLIPGFMITGDLLDRLYLFNTNTDYTYSDMNGYGHFLPGLFWSLTYWLFWSLLLASIGMAFSPRGTDTTWRHRFINARQRFPRLAPLSALFAVVIAGIGTWFFYNTHVLNQFRTPKDDRHLRAAYEKAYKRYQTFPQPKIISVDSAVSIYPERRSFDATGVFVLLNRTAGPIQDIHVTDSKESLYDASFDRPSTITLDDRKLRYRIYRLSKPLASGEQTKMRFHVGYQSHGFRNNGELPELAYNGTFFDQEYFPFIGYNRNVEIDNPVRRREEHLGPLQELAQRGDPYYTDVNLFSPDSDWLTYHAVVSTSGDQIALSPGYLRRKWQQEGRNYFEYSMGNTKTLDFYDFNSARYAVKSVPYEGVNIEVYYHPGHPYDVDDMIASSKAGLDYFQKNYGPFQFRQYRVLEYPRYRAFAQSFPNTIPFSEAIGFIGRVEKPEDIDMTYFVTAHELAHQWWAHQLIGAQVKGSNMMSESLAEYSALRVMEKKYGEANMRKFLRHELDGYLRGRTGEVRHEPPIVLVENEPYVWYQKGSLVFYALSDYIGEDKLNAALKSLLDKYRFAGPPYPDTRDLVSALRAATPADLQYLITDMFENITLYDNKVNTAEVTETPDHKFKVHMVVSAKKLRADGAGNETPLPLHDLIEVGVFSGTKDHEKPIHTEKRWFSQESTSIDFVVDQKPTRAGIDPYSKLIDRNPEDNTMDVEKK